MTVFLEICLCHAHGSIDGLEGFFGLRMMVLVRMQLLCKLPVELSQLCRLHLGHTCHEHLLRGVQELIHQKGLILANRRVGWHIAILHLLHELLCKILCSLIDTLLHMVSPLCLSHEEGLLIATKTSLSHLPLHIFASFGKHLFLHLCVVLVLQALFFTKFCLYSISLIFTTGCALKVSL